MSAELPPQTADQLNHPTLLDRFRDNISDIRTKLGRVGVSTLLALALVTTKEAIDPSPAFADGAKATIGMPFMGKWAYNQNVNPPYTDQNSSHPSVHDAYGFDWATDLYPKDGAGTEVKVHGSSPQSTVTFQRASTSDTCSSYGPNVGGRGVTFNVLVNGVKLGEVKYDHLDLTDVGNNPIASGTKIGVVTGEQLHASCFSARHAHVQFKNTTGNYSCYTDHGNPGITLAAGANLGALGSSNTGRPKQECAGGGGGLPGGPETVGIYDPNGAIFHERNSNTPGSADMPVHYGNPNWIPLSGDWNNDKVFTPGAYDPSTGWFYLSNSNVPGGPPDTPAFVYGNIGWEPIAGDWDGNGYWSVGMHDPNTGIFYLRNMNSAGSADHTFQFGNGGWKPITGDWDGHDDGNPATTIGVYDPNTATYYLNNENDSGAAESTVHYGNLGWTPLAGDWDGNGFSSIGAYDPNTSTFYLRNVNSLGPADATVQYGNIGWKPVVGDWDGQ